MFKKAIVGSGLLAVALCLALAGSALAQANGMIYYVDDDAAPFGAGSSWADAFDNLNCALDVAQPGDQIWVAKGVYYPYPCNYDPCNYDPCDYPGGIEVDPGPNPIRSYTFQLKNGVAVLGGFYGLYAESKSPCLPPPNPNDRDIKDCSGSILCGDLGIPGFVYDNAYHVVTGTGTDNTAILDGFTIRDGYANGEQPDNRGGGMYNGSGSPTVKNCCFIDNYAAALGGGMCNYVSSMPIVVNCTFINNVALIYGGGMCNYGGSHVDITNCVFSQNRALGQEVDGVVFAGHGGGVYNAANSNMVATNCSFSQNNATSFGGAFSIDNSDLYIYNCILWRNVAFAGRQIAHEAGNRLIRISYTNIEGGNSTGSIYRNNATLQYITDSNITTDPKFVDPANHNLRLQLDSLAKDVGSNALVPADVADLDEDGDTGEVLPYDRDCKTRFAGPDVPPIVDMGAYEHPRVHLVWGCRDITPYDCSLMDGITWATAFCYLQDALLIAEPNDEIWVVGNCTYYPDEATSFPGQNDDNRARSFWLVDGVALFGGFTGTETVREQRDFETNLTILSGDLLQNDGGNPFSNDWADNSFHVCRAEGVGPTALLDGFVVEHGYADGTDKENEHSQGGGLYIVGASPTIKNTTFQYNHAFWYGGGIYCEYAEPLLLCNDKFLHNFAKDSGGGVYATDSDVVAIGCDFVSNYNTVAEGSLFGGGMCTDHCDVKLCECTFVDNTAEIDGGAMYNYGSTLFMYACTYTENESGENGGAIYNTECVSMEAVNSTFVGNEAYGNGGAIDNDTMLEEFRLVNCFFGSNRGTDGGAIDNDDMRFGVYVVDSTFVDNAAGLDIGLSAGDVGNESCGGAISNKDVAYGVKIYDSTFQENKAAVDGGAVENNNVVEGIEFKCCNFVSNDANTGSGGAVNNRNSDNVRYTKCTFTSNSCRNHGGGASHTNISNRVSCISSTFEYNSAQDGGGVYNYDIVAGTIYVNTVFCSNTAEGGRDGKGGGMYNELVDDPFKVVNCTFYGNYARDLGGAFYTAFAGAPNEQPSYLTMDLLNSILWGNTAALGNQIALFKDDYAFPAWAKLTIRNSNIEGWLSDFFGAIHRYGTIEVDDSIGNQEADPMFRNVQACDLQLAEGSPSIDTGNNNYVPDGIIKDRKGAPRIIDLIVDQGAFEYGYCGDGYHMPPPADLNLDCVVDYYDLVVFAESWLYCCQQCRIYCTPANLNHDCKVDLYDWQIFASWWGTCTLPDCVYDIRYCMPSYGPVDIIDR